MSNQMIINNLENLRIHMKTHNIDVYIIPSADPHLSEYVANRFKSRAYLTGFTGSAGTAVVTLTEAALFTDGRYFIQATQELQDTTIDLYRMGEPNVPTLNEWLQKNLRNGMILGYDAKLFSYSHLTTIQKDLSHLRLTYIEDQDLIDNIWPNRPTYPTDKVFHHEAKYTGAHISDKLQLIRAAMVKNQATTYILSSLNDIAWLFNMRGNDILYTPVVYAYALITDMSATLYINNKKVPKSIQHLFVEQGIALKPYEDYYHNLEKLKHQHIIFDPLKVNGLMIACLNKTNTLIEAPDLTYMEKSCLNSVEIKNQKKAQIRDGVAMVNFLHWLDTQIGHEDLTEYSAATQLETYRKAQNLFIEPSFETIPAYGGNAAIMHYSTTKESSPHLKAKGLFLVDSGGQYYDGTTDITRTIILGDLTDEERYDYTLVLKAHIRLNRLIFLAGCTGSNIDIIARQPIWQDYMDYKSGTGHSVGYVLGVHEGPARIRKEQSDVVLKPGMIITNEPGIYKLNKHGIRIENTLLVQEVAKNDMGIFYHFEVLSFCPIDTRGIDINVLSKEEITWLNNYHKKVFNTLAPFVNTATKQWLETATRPL